MCLEKGGGGFVVDAGLLFLFFLKGDPSLTFLESYTIFLAAADTFQSSFLDQFVTTKLKPTI